MITAREMQDLLLRPDAHDSATAVKLGRHVSDVLTFQLSPHITKVSNGRALLVLLIQVEHSELLVVGQRVDLGGAQEGGVVDGAVVEGLDDNVVLVGYPGVVNIHETVGRPGKQDVRGLGRMEA